MRENPRPFTQRQDELIRYLYNTQNIKNWGLIASTLTDQYNFPRNAKQCRDRFKQYIDPNMQMQWTAQQQMYLNKLHNSIGNKWALMSQYFPGKTDNCLKNHFYSKLRKGLRYLNKIIKNNFKKEYKDIKMTCIYKIIEGFQEKFREKSCVSEEMSDQCAKLKNILFLYADRSQGEEEMNDLSDEKIVIAQIIEFNKNYKKKTRKQKRQSLQVSQLFKPSTQISRSPHKDNPEDDGSDQESNQSEKSEEKSQQQPKLQNIMEEQHNQQPDLRRSERVCIIVEDQQIRISQQSKLPLQVINYPDQNLISSYRPSEQQNRFAKDLLRWSGSNDHSKFPFGFLRGSSFQSYRSQSNPSEIERVDMFDENIRISQELKKQIRMQQQNQDLFRSNK